MRQSYRPGDVVYGRMENIGTETVGDLPGYRVERLTATGWVRVGPSGLGRPPAPPPILTAGKARGIAFRIPNSARRGKYRLAKWAERHDGDDEYSPTTVWADFDVASAYQRATCYCSSESKAGNRRRPESLRRPGGLKPLLVEQGVQVRLGTKSKRVQRGQIAVARVENLGTVAVSYKPSFAIERLTDIGWASFATLRTKWHRGSPVRIAPGWVGFCQPFEVPLDAELGRYRFAKHVQYFDSAEGHGQEIVLTSEFEVVP